MRSGMVTCAPALHGPVRVAESGLAAQQRSVVAVAATWDASVYLSASSRSSYERGTATHDGNVSLPHLRNRSPRARSLPPERRRLHSTVSVRSSSSR